MLFDEFGEVVQAGGDGEGEEDKGGELSDDGEESENVSHCGGWV